ncbi:MAG: sugar kinase [Desulfamplus sp.]|nr:sugar kinase [Desulfamplus sp.]
MQDKHLKKVVTFGEILLRLSPPLNLRFSQANSFDLIYGGSEYNVAVSLANYKIETEFITRLPDNDLGHCAVMEMKKRDIGIQNVIYGGERLGIYFIEKGAASRRSKIIYDRSNSSMYTIKPATICWSEVFKNAGWFHWSGITPSISQNAADCCLEAIEIANKMGLTISCDLNHRTKLWKYTDNPASIMKPLLNATNIICCNEEDTHKFFGLKPQKVDVNNGNTIDEESYIHVCKELMDRFASVKKVAISLRKSLNADNNAWAGILYDGNSFYKSNTYHITHIVDRIGSGDAFMAGIIYGFLNYDNDQDTLDFAVAASCLKHTIYGDVNLVTKEEVETLISGDSSGRVTR